MSDGLAAIDKTIFQIFGGIPHEECVVHLQRDLKAYVARDNQAEPAKDIRQVIGVDGSSHRIDDAFKQVEHLSVKWTEKYPALGKYIVRME